MVESIPRPAAPGDIFILLTPASDIPADYDWQSALQARYGGQCTKPLHISVQRFVCPGTARLAAFLDGLQEATVTLMSIQIEGSELQPLYSAFRQNTLLKCRVLVSEPLRELSDRVLRQMQAHKLQPYFPWYSSLVTVLEAIERLPEETTITLPMLLPLFTGRQILISRIVAPSQYQHLRQWQLQQTI